MNDKPSQEMNLSLVIKLLKMTTSANDAEALVAMRKANSIVTSAGWDWERLLLSKVKIIADPFSTLGKPDNAKSTRTPTPAPKPDPDDPWGYSPPPRPSRPARPSRPQASPFQNAPPPPPPSAPTGWANLSSRPNSYSGYCYCCGVFVNDGKGFVFKPSQNSVKWECVCSNCNKLGWASVPSKPASRQRRTSANDLLNGI